MESKYISKLRVFNIIAGIILILIIGALFFQKQYQGSPVQSQTTVPQMVKAAKPGELVEGVPSDLIVVQGAAVQKSEEYTTKSPSGSIVQVLLTIYTTPVPLEVLFNSYEKYVSSHNYTVTKAVLTKDSGMIIFSSTSSTGSTIWTISINKLAAMQQVTIVGSKQ